MAQLSPGDLTQAHQHLEGLSNCTECHVLGEKVTNQKCLACHTEIDALIKKSKGYHASNEVEGKDCFACHSEHHGRKFQITRLDTSNFNHAITGYILEGKHAKTDCMKCHQSANIDNKISQKKGDTFLGLETSCLSCHDDYHQKTMDQKCTSCHGFDSFAPAIKFDHQQTEYPLIGQHQKVDCSKCHKIGQQNGQKFQQFSDLEFANCTACHKDVHDNKFGQDCRQCHSEQSFHQVAGLADFNHNQTGYPLKGKHQKVDCRRCHKGSYTEPIAHNRCSSCHADYHKGQFIENGVKPDCEECHTVDGFTPSFFTVEKHNKGNFKLEASHLATPCFACHQKENERWEFRNVGKQCVDCHENIHQGFISEKYIPENRCETCHNIEAWNQVSFDHRKTNFNLTGKHAETNCRECHFALIDEMNFSQKFKDLSVKCESCHADVHRKQFEVKSQTECDRCHSFDNWEIGQFDHDKTRFKLEGAHVEVNCEKCHKPVDDKQGTYVKYKLFKQIKCANCHS
ncbi:hypothetical protein ACUNWD_00635 [Sunxiuqinia sp. A32]|uniref:hypothetical protein n=1 Tax=Sunxiuqinia sp. A32 TaxID=3461496 RepID=UPI0040465143